MKNFLFFSFIIIGLAAEGQKIPCPSSLHKKAIKQYEHALKLVRGSADRNMVYAACESAFQEDSTFVHPLLLLADHAIRIKDFKKMIWAYERLNQICPEADTNIHFTAAEYMYQQEKYAEATTYYQNYLSFASMNEEQNQLAELKLYRCQLYLNPRQFNPIPIDSITTINPEYLPAISPDDEWFYLTRRYDEKTLGSFIPRNVEKLLFSSHQKGIFSSAKPMPPPFNMTSNNNEGGPSLSIDNKRMFFTINRDGNFDIYMSVQYAEQKWTEPENLGSAINDPVQWDAQPSIGPDGRTLYFTTYRDSVHGTSDIFISNLQHDGTWSSATPLPSPVNTSGNEKSPFIHPDGMTLYFASDGHIGLGGLDIFLTRKDSTGKWSQPVNLGYPINSAEDDVSFIVNTAGNRAYFASSKISKSGGYNIYSASIDSSIKPQKVLFVKGEIKDQNNGVPLAARIELKNVNTNEVINISYDSLSGHYASVVLFDSDYLLSLKKDSAAFEAQYLSMKDTLLATPASIDIAVKKIEKGSTFSFNNVLFESNSAILSREAKTLIHAFADYLKEHPTLIIEIAGHTDNQGNASDNQILSEQRSTSVKKHLIECGISTRRLLSKGYGMSKPIVNNDTEENRSLNRRTEFVIVSP